MRKEDAENEKEIKKKEKLDKANERIEKAQEAKLKTDADIINEQTKELLTVGAKLLLIYLCSKESY